MSRFGIVRLRTFSLFLFYFVLSPNNKGSRATPEKISQFPEETKSFSYLEVIQTRLLDEHSSCDNITE